jgi:hypothetical protein
MLDEVLDVVARDGSIELLTGKSPVKEDPTSTAPLSKHARHYS